MQIKHKKTGVDITKEVIDLLNKKITREEFERLIDNKK